MVSLDGKEASEFTRRLVEGKKVRLEYEYQLYLQEYEGCPPQSDNPLELKDRYGRTLAYVFLDDNSFLDRWGTMLNAKIIREGYGLTYTKYPFCLQGEFVRLEREAREAGRGLWQERQQAQE